MEKKEERVPVLHLTLEQPPHQEKQGGGGGKPKCKECVKELLSHGKRGNA